MNDITSKPDWHFMQNGPTTLFKSQKLFEDATEDMRDLGYLILNIDCETDEKVLASFVDGLHWQNQFGYRPEELNLDALNDAVRGEPFDSCDRAVVAFDHFQGFWKRDQDTAFAVLDIFASASRSYLIFGKRLLSFIKVSDPNIHIDGLGATAAIWNDKEWLNKDRGL